MSQDELQRLGMLARRLERLCKEAEEIRQQIAANSASRPAWPERRHHYRAHADTAPVADSGTPSSSKESN